jgi:hypothetical protein
MPTCDYKKCRIHIKNKGDRCALHNKCSIESCVNFGRRVLKVGEDEKKYFCTRHYNLIRTKQTEKCDSPSLPPLDPLIDPLACLEGDISDMSDIEISPDFFEKNPICDITVESSEELPYGDELFRLSEEQKKTTLSAELSNPEVSKTKLTVFDPFRAFKRNEETKKDGRKRKSRRKSIRKSRGKSRHKSSKRRSTK